MHIAFFDSGLGGLSIIQAFLNHPNSRCVEAHQYSYIADTGAFPYGDKAASWLSARILRLINSVINQTHPDLVVIACNTASTLALEQLRLEFDIPFIGVVPAIKPAVQSTQTGTIGVLATPATVARDYTAQLIADYAPTQQVILHGSTELVTQAERTLLNLPVNTQILQHSLKALLQQPGGNEIDTIVLACTHFPLLKNELEKQLSKLQSTRVTWIDSGEAIARRIIELSTNISQNGNSASHKKPSPILMTTGGPTAATYLELFTHQPQLLQKNTAGKALKHIDLII